MITSVLQLLLFVLTQLLTFRKKFCHEREAANFFLGPGCDFFAGSFNNPPNSSYWPSYDQSSQVAQWQNPPPISWLHLLLLQPHSSLPREESERRHAVPLNTEGGPHLYLLASQELSPGQRDKITF